MSCGHVVRLLSATKSLNGFKSSLSHPGLWAALDLSCSGALLSSNRTKAEMHALLLQPAANLLIRKHDCCPTEGLSAPCGFAWHPGNHSRAPFQASAERS